MAALPERPLFSRSKKEPSEHATRYTSGTLSVTGTASVKGEVEEALLRLRVTVIDTDIAQAWSGLGGITSAIDATIENHKEVTMHTGTISIEERTKRVSDGNVYTTVHAGYAAESALRVTIPAARFDHIGTLLGEIISIGGPSIQLGGITYLQKERKAKEAKMDALARANEDMHKRARTLAEKNSVQLKRLLTITDGTRVMHTPAPRTRMRVHEASFAVSDVSMPVQPEALTTHARVQAVYAIVDTGTDI